MKRNKKSIVFNNFIRDNLEFCMMVDKKMWSDNKEKWLELMGEHIKQHFRKQMNKRKYLKDGVILRIRIMATPEEHLRR